MLYNYRIVNSIIVQLKRLTGLAIAFCLFANLIYPVISYEKAVAQSVTTASSAKVSFTFDDGLASAALIAQPTLAKYGLTATDYVITGCVGMTAIPNTCHANTDASYMTWPQISSLKEAGWEIGSHTATHPYLASSDSTDGQPNVLTQAQVEVELSKSKSDLLDHGIDAQALSTPYGDYTPSTLAQIARYYSSHRGFAEQNLNGWPYNDYLLNNMQVQEGVTVAQVKSKIDEAIASNQWLILTMHDIKSRPSKNADDYEYGTAELDQIASYVKSKQDAGLITSTNITAGLVSSNNESNLTPNSSFNNGIADGWHTDSPTTITVDSNNNGSYPDSQKSIKLTSSSQTKHLFSPQLSVSSYNRYMLKNFVNVSGNSGGELGFYIDEYDSAGNWVSGQYRAAERGNFVEDINFSYTPSSPLVTKASLQVIVTANSGITAYLDNSEWFVISSQTPVARTNLITNGTFVPGLNPGWVTDDSEHITADRTIRGGPVTPIDSVILTSNNLTNGHLFSDAISVDNSKLYQIQSYLNIFRLSSGVIGFYVDEYDSSGTWISGSYIGDASTVGEHNQSFTYKPTSSQVTKASLQIIVVNNSSTLAYLDDISWFQL